MAYIKITDYAAKDALLSGNPNKIITGTALGADFDAIATYSNTTMGSDAAAVHSATTKVTPVDADETLLMDSAASYGLKKVTWANMKAALAGAITTSGHTMNTLRILGRTTAATGAIEELTVTSPLALSAGTLTTSLATARLAGRTTAGTGELEAISVAGGLTLSAGVLTATPTSGTVQASTSGTSIDFTSLPAGTKRIMVLFNGVSTSGTNPILIQIGSGSFTASGYLGGCSGMAATVATETRNTGFEITYSGIQAAASVWHGIATIALVNSASNIWTESSTVAKSDAAANCLGSGTVSLGGALDRVRITSVGSTDTFDAGSINIIYE